MITYIQKMGNSLAVYIPKAFAEDLKLRPKSAVEIKEEKGMLTITPMGAREYSLEELLSQITPENLHGEIETGKAVGNEVW